MSNDADAITGQAFRGGFIDTLPQVFCRFRYTSHVICFDVVSRAVLDWTGCAPEVFVSEGRNWLNQIHPSDRRILPEAIAQCESREKGFVVEYRILTAADSIRYVRHTAKCEALSACGQEPVWNGCIEDITSFQQIRQDLERTSRRYKKMVANVPGIVFECLMRSTGELEFVFISGSCVELIGIPPEQIYADSGLFFKAFAAEDRSVFYRKLAESAEHLTPLLWQGCHTMDTTQRWFQCTARPEPLADGRVLWDGLLMDITEQKESERKAEFLAQFPKENPNPVMRINEDGRIIYANQASHPLQELWDRQTGQLLPQDLYELAVAARQSGDPLTHEVRCKDHYYRIVFAPVHPGLDVNLYARDVTSVKIVELELRNANRELIEHDQLKSEFVSTVTHELRTPLCIFHNILSNALAGVHGPLKKRLKEDLEMAQQEVERLSRIISDFLDVSKIEAGSLQLEFDDCLLNDLIVGTCRSLKPLAAAKKIAIQTTLPGKQIVARMDRDRIVQVLVNLIGNAIKFIPIGGQINVKLEDDDDQVTIRVQDNGAGMTPEEMSRIFDRFVQARILKGPGQHGTGIGLTISRELVKMHGGRIWVESQIGQGCVFSFSLPKRPSSDAEQSAVSLAAKS